MCGTWVSHLQEFSLMYITELMIIGKTHKGSQAVLVVKNPPAPCRSCKR